MKQSKLKQDEPKQKKDKFIEFSGNFLLWLQNHRKIVRRSFLFAFVVVLVVLVIYFVLNQRKVELSHQYYEASAGWESRLLNAQEETLYGRRLTEDELEQLISGYQEMVSGSSIENILARWNLALSYYSAGEYLKASEHFGSLSDEKDFPFSFLASLNRGHSFLNLGYQKEQSKDFSTAVGDYQKAIEIYEKTQEDFSDSPAFLISYKYLGLSLESLARVHSSLNQNQKESELLKRAKKEYQTLRRLAKKNPKTNVQGGRRNLVEEADIGLRRLGSLP